MNKTITVSLRMSALALALSQAYGPAAHAQATAPSAEPTTVVVTGIRASARSAVAIKKDSMEVMDVITAEDIGKLPDTNVAETLTRIPGVQGYRYGGEGASPVGQGSGLTIRGLAGLTAAQVNGRSFATAGSRDYNIEGANPAMIAAVEVFKNPSAEHIEGGIGGLINVKTRNPSDFKGPTGGFAINGKWNDVAKKTDPEYFGMLANRWDLGGGQRFGVMVAGTYAKSTNRSDNNPANGGANYKRIVRADSAEYATLAAANTANDIRQPLSKYVGRTDVSHLAGVPTLATSSTVGANVPNTAGLTQAQIDNIISAPTVTNNVFQETIMRERKGLNLAADYRVSNTLRFYAEANWVYYLYHQHYRGLNAGNLSSNVQNLQTTPFALTEGLANRNLNGGSDDVLNNKRFLSGTFLDETVNTMGGIEKHPYETGIGAVGADWNVTPDLWLKADFSYTKSQQKVNNRNVVMDSAPGLTWGVNRVIDGAPHQLTFTGPDLANPNNFVFRSFDNGNNAVTDDSGYALALDGAWSGDMPFLNKLKFGTRYAHAESDFSPFGFGGRQLTKDGLARNTANQIFVGSTSVWENAPTNFMRGDAGYSGGYVVYQPEMLLGDQVRTLFPNAGIPAQPYVEQPNNHRWVGENTLAFYLSGDFTALDDRLRGNVGVRAVRTEGEARARILDRTKATETYVDNLQSTSYTHYLPSLNMTYDLAKDFMVRAGFGKSLTRAALGDLNPSVNPNLSDGSGGMGNPNLRPTTATSFDLSVERYFTSTNYIAAGVFYKDISGLVNDVLQCQTVPNAPLYTGTNPNGCTNGQYRVAQKVNSEDGYAKGAEVSGQWFFDSSYGYLKNFGMSASYTYVVTSTPLNFGTLTAPRRIDSTMPWVSKNSYSVQAMYEDSKLSARLGYVYRSDFVLFGASNNPIDGRYIKGFGMLSGALNYKLNDNFTLSFHASNINNSALNRNVGEPGAYATPLERQHYENGRVLTVGLRYTFGNK